jgi:hypothetical protein
MRLHSFASGLHGLPVLGEKGLTPEVVRVAAASLGRDATPIVRARWRYFQIAGKSGSGSVSGNGCGLVLAESFWPDALYLRKFDGPSVKLSVPFGPRRISNDPHNFGHSHLPF